MPFEIR